MVDKLVRENIPIEMALKLCESIYQKSPRLSLAGMQCWGCRRFTKSAVDKRCFANGIGNRGCQLINKSFDAQNLADRDE
jgi:hypothetical protein